MKKTSSIFSALALLTTATVTLEAYPQETTSALKSNGQIIYTEKPKHVNSFWELFSKGEFHGRVRNNNFYYWYDDDAKNSHYVIGLGASLLYKSANYNGFDFTLAGYGARAFFEEDKSEVGTIRSGKDLFSRYNYTNTGSKSLYTFAQANIAYNYAKTKFTLGRQLVETFYTKSNDTKMIPNSFDGLVIDSKDLKETKLKVAYLAQQKLRDHQDGHSVLMYGDTASTSANNAKWSQNDDSAMHKGLTYTALKAAGKPTKAPLLVLDAQNSSIKDLKINFAAYSVPELISQMMGEVNYQIKMDGFSINPGIRFIQQFDNGAGKVGGAAYDTDTTGYKDPNSLDSQMIAARLVTKFSDYKINLGYTNILDKADLITPWRGFPTAGYTRSMAVYNWRANTKSYRLELVKGDNKTGIYKDGYIQTSVLYIDGDKTKNDGDTMVYYFGWIQNLPSMPQFQYRYRLGYFQGLNGTTDSIDTRVEFNYLF